MCWLNVRGQFNMSELPSGVVYEIAYMAKDQWIELVGSRFEAKEGEAGEVCFDLMTVVDTGKALNKVA
ncbi:phloem protein 2 A5 [Prunus dulcis]|uniref:Phloem protein 2 A5 n=1 Tax=Prunus dulcis TaxID=3755 RepID=A0A4Y1R4U3_PRUDU|nr:phloem protein 2 A5 [Prunus dulcis]